MPTRLFWYPELDNKMRLLYSYIITYKDFSFSNTIYISSNKCADKLPMDRRTITNTLNKMKDLNILNLSPTNKQNGTGVGIKKDFTKMSDLEDKWIHTHSIEAERENNDIENEEDKKKNEKEMIKEKKEISQTTQKEKQSEKQETELQKQIKLEWKEFLQVCNSQEYKIYDEINHKEIIFTEEVCRDTYKSWKTIYPNLDAYQLHHEFMKEWYKDYKLKKIKNIKTDELDLEDKIYQAI